MARIRKNGQPDKRYGKKGPRPNLWKTGPDPVLHQLRIKFLRARVQARYWCQPWQMTFEQYADRWLSQGIDPRRPARDPDSQNLCRIDKGGAWSVENTVMRRRQQQMTRAKTRHKNGEIKTRQRRNAGGPVKPFKRNQEDQ